ncbi:hypothetical protein [Flexithrix dorotheae]|uniref:hypothetical protein n=1 Tax=Flexithrix dorotheae TaxID=70993 RepID=UPI00037620AC|nr:hypothetical protein [Flexithrix dorotheae]
MKDLIIPKNNLRFLIEISSNKEKISINTDRFLQVCYDEDMSVNAPLAQFESIKVNGKYINCHELIKDTLEFIAYKLEVDQAEICSTFRLKKQKSFPHG